MSWFCSFNLTLIQQSVWYHRIEQTKTGLSPPTITENGEIIFPCFVFILIWNHSSYCILTRSPVPCCLYSIRSIIIGSNLNDSSQLSRLPHIFSDFAGLTREPRESKTVEQESRESILGFKKDYFWQALVSGIFRTIFVLALGWKLHLNV